MLKCTLTFFICGASAGLIQYWVQFVYNTIQYNTIQSNLFQLSYMSIIIIIHCIFLNEKSKRICRKLNKLIRDIPRITHIVCMCELHILYACVERSHTGNALCAAK